MISNNDILLIPIFAFLRIKDTISYMTVTSSTIKADGKIGQERVMARLTQVVHKFNTSIWRSIILAASRHSDAFVFPTSPYPNSSYRDNSYQTANRSGCRHSAIVCLRTKPCSRQLGLATVADVKYACIHRIYTVMALTKRKSALSHLLSKYHWDKKKSLSMSWHHAMTNDGRSSIDNSQHVTAANHYINILLHQYIYIFAAGLPSTHCLPTC